MTHRPNSDEKAQDGDTIVAVDAFQISIIATGR